MLLERLACDWGYHANRNSKFTLMLEAEFIRRNNREVNSFDYHIEATILDSPVGCDNRQTDGGHLPSGVPKFDVSIHILLMLDICVEVAMILMVMVMGTVERLVRCGQIARWNTMGKQGRFLSALAIHPQHTNGLPFQSGETKPIWHIQRESSLHRLVVVGA